MARKYPNHYFNAAGRNRFAGIADLKAVCPVCGEPEDSRHDAEACAEAWIKQVDAEKAKEGRS